MFLPFSLPLILPPSLPPSFFPPSLPPSSHSTEEQAVLISGVVGGEVVQVEYPNLEGSEVGTETEVGHYAHRENLYQGR